MRITSVRIKNFGLLREGDFSFSSSGLTIIRGNNASGKTTILDALRWGLYGDNGLVVRRKSRMSATDLTPNSSCSIRIEIDLERTLGTPEGEEHENYRLVREVVESDVDGVVRRGHHSVSLYQITSGGLVEEPSPDRIIEVDLLPLELKDVFIIDGDEALAFVSPQLSQADKRNRVKDAIRSLLGLSLLEASEEHLRQVESKFRRVAGDELGDDRLKIVETEINEKEKESEEIKKRIDSHSSQIELLRQQEAKSDQDLEEALKIGDYDDLVGRKRDNEDQIKSCKDILGEFKVDHRRAMEKDSLSWALIKNELSKGFTVLEGLRQRGIIPRSALPFIKDRLNEKVCICGASLELGVPARLEVERRIAEHKEADEERQLQAELLTQLRSDIASLDASQLNWLEEINRTKANRLSIQKSMEAARRELVIIEQQIEGIDKDRIRTLRQLRDSLRESRANQVQTLGSEQINLSRSEDTLKRKKEEFDELLKNAREAQKSKVRLQTVADVRQIISGTLKDIQEIHLSKVSERMSAMFSEIIGAYQVEDGVQTGAVTGTSITNEHDIIVHTAQGADLMPWQLNGAAQRALTFSLIAALTEVSGIEAPRIIDAPLGTMDGAVKRRAVELVAGKIGDKCSDYQVVMFLTRSEIAQIEDLLDDRAKANFTITNTSHFPEFLVNDPMVNQAQIRVCTCSHRVSCQLCQRKDDEIFGVIFKREGLS